MNNKNKYLSNNDEIDLSDLNNIVKTNKSIINNEQNEINLLNYQVKHYSNIKNAIIKYSRAIDASDTGTGKTYISVKLCKDLNLIPYVICPKSVISSWNRIIEQGGIKKYYVINYEQLNFSTHLIKSDTDKYDWNFESNDKFMGNNIKKYLFIYDEAHKCKKYTTIKSKIMVSLSQYPVYILLLSATIIDKPLFFLPFGIVLKLYKTIEEGLCWFNKVITTFGNKKTFNMMLPIHNIIFDKYASRMRIEDTIDIFKKNKIIFEGINMQKYWEIEQKYVKIYNLLEQGKKTKLDKNKKLSKSKKIYDNADLEVDSESESESESDSESKSDESESNKIKYQDIYNNNNSYNNFIKKSKKTNNHLSQIQKLRQEIEFIRIDEIHKLVLKYLEQSKSIVIFVNFTDTIIELSKRLNCDCIIWGKQSLKERTKSIDDFCSDKSRIIICNIQSGSAGISLHDTIGKYPRISIISPTWSAQDLIQALGRIHRAMGKTDCEQQIIFCKGTIEESVSNIIRQKINNIRCFNDGNQKLKNDNMECILKNELIKKKKIEEKNEYIYKINDFDSIQNRIDKLEENIVILSNELEKYEINSNEYKECEYRLNKIKNELNFNLSKLNETINNMIA